MKILIVNDYITNIGGTEKYIYSLKEFLEKKQHTVLIHGSDKNLEEYKSSQKNISLYKYFIKIFNINTYWNLKKIINDINPDIIHIQNFYNELSPSILLAIKNIPTIMTVHDCLMINPVSILSDRTGKECKKRTCRGCLNCIGWKGTIYEKIKYPIHKKLLNKISLFITPSYYMNDFMQEAGFNPIITIPNGIKMLKYSKIKNYYSLLYIGRLTKEKGLEYLLRAMPEIITRFPDVKLQLIGDGVNKDYFVDIIEKLNIKNNINFVGSIGTDEIEKYYHDSSIVIVPSIFPDNFPTVCIEAMSAGRPIIGTAMGGIPELIDDSKTGFLVPPYDSQKLAEKIITLLSDKQLLMQMSANAKQKSLLYSIENHVEKLERIYLEQIKK